jgi:3-hydroxyacyl-[acyl-carrier-protein] dehydratase
MSWKIIIEKNEIEKILPHRGKMLLVDSVIEYEKNETITTIKQFKQGDSYFQGHFPDEPILAGIYIQEALCQTGGILFELIKRNWNIGEKIFNGLETCNLVVVCEVNMKFTKPLIPNFLLVLNAKIDWYLGDYFSIDVKAEKDNVICAKGTIKMLKTEKNKLLKVI